MDHRFLVISSQYYWQHICFVVDADMPDDELHDRLCQMVTDLENYKRSAPGGSPEFGDIGEKHWKGFVDGRRYNINDCGGDFYIFCVNTVSKAMAVVEEQKDDTHRQLSQFSKSEIRKLQESIDAHHDKRKVALIVWKHFTIA